MSVSNVALNFVNNELWVSRGAYWIESGITIGRKAHDSPSGGYVTVPTSFWAQNNPATVGYVETYGAAVSLNTYYRSAILYAAPNTWNVRAGNTTGQVTNTWSGAALTLQVGHEALDSGALSYGSSSALTYRNLTGSDVSGWSPTASYQFGGLVSWQTYGSWLRSGIPSLTC